ncbi:hypothetical protein PN462_01480 [Spirulina sp. CS-785/01]|uniref:hypothetical protein n=1 Tax=Spirulina sp. CS-785/01 TaxID=3021716 RepID=UPI00232D444C|nr:hypothetical protein [Spirulina sp. CS-785/01]MDB9311755.1 hypothetical protein [Spirulina sp. CS-785/01]
MKRFQIGRSVLRFLLLVFGVSLGTVALAQINLWMVVVLMGFATGVSLWQLWESQIKQRDKGSLAQEKEEAIASLTGQLDQQQQQSQSSYDSLATQFTELQEAYDNLQEEQKELETQLQEKAQLEDQLIAELEEKLQADEADSANSANFQELKKLNRTLESQKLQLQNELNRLKARHDRLQANKWELTAKLNSLQYQFGKANNSEAEPRTELQQLLIKAINRKLPTLEESLLIISQLFPDRIVVLESAWKSARESAIFKNKNGAFDLLWTLANEYWERCYEGQGDAQARKVFTNHSYAARESDTVERNQRAKQLRTFYYQGEPIEMMKHLKIGTRNSLADTLRIHFEWKPEEGKIIIGHCGKHLDHN